LVVDADAVLTLPVTFKFLQSVSRGKPQILQISCRIQHREFAFGHASRRRPLGPAGSPDFRRSPGGETLDHTLMITMPVNNVNRYYHTRSPTMLYSFPK
jgi:hypothetical protein